MLFLAVVAQFVVAHVSSTEATIRNESEISLNSINEQEETSFNHWLPIDQWSTVENLLVNVTTNTPEVIEILNSDYPLVIDNRNDTHGRNLSVSIKGLSFGYGKLSVIVYTNDSEFSIENSTLLSTTYKINVVIIKSLADKIILVCITFLLILNNINIGCALEYDLVKEHLKKPISPIVGFLLQFLFVPLIAYGFATALLCNSKEQFGLFILACSPDEVFGNFWVLLFRGDVNLSVIMTFINSFAAIGMIPLWLMTFGVKFIEDIQIPFDKIIISLISFIVPISFGWAVRRWKQPWAKVSENIVRPYTVIVLLTYFLFEIYANHRIFALMTLKVVVAGLCISWGVFIVAALFSRLFCLKIEQIIAVSIETALQNYRLAVMILTLSLLQPDADFATVTPFAQLLVTEIPLWIAYIFHCLYSQYSSRKDPSLRNLHTPMLRTIFKKADRPRSRTSTGASNDLWISVPSPQDDEEMITIKSFQGDAEEDIVWQRN